MYLLQALPLITFALFLIVISSASPLPQSGSVEEDTGQVTINDQPDANTTVTNVPIIATIFAGVPGPKRCRGGPMHILTLPPPDGLGTPTNATCYNLRIDAGCGNFVANKADGCQANLFADLNCVSYTNTVVFIPENRAVGGRWRSLSVRCGVPEPDPSTLGAPPLAGMITKQGPKKTKGTLG